MRNFAIGLVVGLISGCVSGITCYHFVTKKKTEDYINEEVKKVRDYYIKKETKEVLGAEADGDEGDTGNTKKHVNAIPDKPIPNKYKNITTSYRNRGTEEDTDEDEEDEEDYDQISPPEDRPDIEIVSVEEFADTDYKFEESALLYYTKDETLCYEDTEEIIVDIKGTVGDISEWMKDDDNEETIFVRNNRTGESFEINKIFGNYHEELDE